MSEVGTGHIFHVEMIRPQCFHLTKMEVLKAVLDLKSINNNTPKCTNFASEYYLDLKKHYLDLKTALSLNMQTVSNI